LYACISRFAGSSKASLSSSLTALSSVYKKNGVRVLMNFGAKSVLSQSRIPVRRTVVGVGVVKSRFRG
jgi:hypothetical protein